jgi:nucleotide-binding universal stress UspA family protein
MRTIIVINDNSDQALHAAEVALTIAQKNKANLLLANYAKSCTLEYTLTSVPHDFDIKNELTEDPEATLAHHLATLNAVHTGFKPQISDLDISELSKNELVEFINKNNIWMLVQGCGDTNADVSLNFIDTCSLLNFVKCPLLFIPESFDAVQFERIVYMTDLRYCQLSVARFMASFSKNYEAKLLVAHLSASGMPDMEQAYATSLFKETVGRYISYTKLKFNNIKEKSLEKAVDVLVHGLNTELLVLVNHQFHYKEVLNKFFSVRKVPQIGIPLLLFPF